MNFDKAKKSVVKLLTEDVATRDDDNLLIVETWKHQGLGEKASIDALLTKLQKGELSPPETITRVRRKLQEKHKNLRGHTYYIRKNLEQEAKNQLKMFD